MCGAEDEGGTVTTHNLAVDGHGVEFEACDKCWDKKILKVVAPLHTAGRKPAPPKRKKIKVTPWPGSPWNFTHHALQRLGERRIAPLDAVAVIEDPATTRPGNKKAGEPNGTVYSRDNLQVVADPKSRVIFTVALRDD